MSELFEGMPKDIIEKNDSIEDYSAYLKTERKALSVSNGSLERADSIDDLRKIIQIPQFTSEVREQILIELRRGEYPENAAAMAGIPTKIWREWMTFAKNGLEPYYTFWRECFKAEAEAQAECQRLLRQSEAGAKFLLERRFSRPSLAEDPLSESPTWRKQTNQELEISLKGEEDLNLTALKPKDRVKMIAEIARAVQQSEALEGEYDVKETDG